MSIMAETSIVTVKSKSNEISSRKGKYAMLVILGKDNKNHAETALRVSRAYPDGCVLWADSMQVVKELMDDIGRAGLTDTERLDDMMKNKPNEVLGFAISLEGVVADIITKNQPINSIRFQAAFANTI